MRASALLAFNLNVAAVSPSDDVNQSKPQSGSLDVSCAALLDTVETIEQAG